MAFFQFQQQLKGILAVFYIFQGRGAEDESWKADSRITSVATGILSSELIY